MTVRFKLQLVVMADDEEVCEEIVMLDKQHERLEHLGLSLAEAKALLVELQHQILTRQVAAFLAAHVPCPSCSRARGIKDRKTIVFRTLFGKLELASPRLRRCPCQHDGRLSASPLVELLSHMIPDYGARWRANQIISTAFIESLVNSLLAKRFVKKQSMQWTPNGAHLLLQIRTRILNNDLAATFGTWYPDFSITDHAVHQHTLAA
jgi:hypothetical protein